MLGEEALQVLLGLLRPLASLHSAEGFPKLGERGNRFARFSELARVLGYRFGEAVECLVLRFRSGSSSPLLRRTRCRPVQFPRHGSSRPMLSLAGALDLLDPASGASTRGEPGPILWIASSLGAKRVGFLRSGGVRTSGLAQLAMTAMYTVADHPANLIWVGEWMGWVCVNST